MTNEERRYEIGMRAVTGAHEGVPLRNRVMTEDEARRIILDDPQGNIVNRMMAIAVARSILGENCTMKEIWEWAEK